MRRKQGKVYKFGSGGSVPGYEGGGDVLAGDIVESEHPTIGGDTRRAAMAQVAGNLADSPRAQAAIKVLAQEAQATGGGELAREAVQEAKGVGKGRKQSFKEAFAAARAAGKPDFEWNGKMFSTELAPRRPATPAAPAGVPAQAALAAGAAPPAAAAAAMPPVAPARPPVQGNPMMGGNPALQQGAMQAAGRLQQGMPPQRPPGMAGGGKIRYATGGSIDGCATRGKTRAKRY